MTDRKQGDGALRLLVATASLADARGGLGWLQPPSWAQFFSTYFFLAKDFIYLIFFYVYFINFCF